MKLLIKISFAMMLIGLHQVVSASDQTGQITMFATPNGNSPSGVIVSGSRSAAPACATEGMWSFTDDSLLASLLTIYMNNLTVSIHGTGTCSQQQPTREEIGWISISK